MIDWHGVTGGSSFVWRRVYKQSLIDFLAGNDAGLGCLAMVDFVADLLALVANGDAALAVLTNLHLGLAHGIAGTGSLYLIDDVFILQRQIFTEDTGRLQSQDLFQFFGSAQRPVRIMGAARRDCKTLVKTRQEIR